MLLRYTLLGGLLALAGQAAAQVATVPMDTARAPVDTTARPRRFGVGLTGGAAYSSLLGSDAYNGYGASYRWGYHAGLTADVRLSQHLTLHPEALLVRKGSDFNDPVLDYHLMSIDVPVLVRFHTGDPFTGNTLFVEAGPLASTLLRARRQESDADITSDFTRVNLEFMLGVGYRFKGLSLGLRYSTGITPAYKRLDAARTLGKGSYRPDATSEMFLLSLGYTLGL